MINYALEGPKWTTSVVTWAFARPGDADYTGAIGAGYQAAIRTAAAQWSAATNLTLQEVPPGTPGVGITVGWGNFSGTQIGETRYSYSVGTVQAFMPGMTILIQNPAGLPLDPAPGATYAGTATTLAQVALHEFGHALGLGLSTDPNAVMNIRLGPANTAIDASDIAGAAALYGMPAGRGQVAASTAGPDVVPLDASTIGVYRYFDGSSGTQFLTSSPNEMNAIGAQRPDMRFEGLAMAGILPAAADAGASPVFRFFDTRNGTHFFTIDRGEAATVLATRPDLVAEQSSFSEHGTAQAGDVAVYRFFDTGAGTHFFTASDTERASLVSTRADLTYEGVAFYAPAAT